MTPPGGGPAADGGSLVRALHGAVAVPGLAAPHDTVHFRLFHPARYTGGDAERLTGILPPDRTAAPWPVVLLLPGMNVGPEGFRWLAESLAASGVAVLTYALVGETMPGVVGITAGLDLEACRPGEYGTRPTATAIGPLLAALRGLADPDGPGPLAGLLDLDRVVLGGHSAGGTVALQNAAPQWFPGVVGVFALASHTMASTFLGHAPSTILPVPAPLPTLLLAAELDGVVAASSDRYAAGGSGHDPIRRTFDEAVVGGRGDCWFAVLRGATHVSFVSPRDDTTARGFLDPPHGRDVGTVLATTAAAVAAFVDVATGRDVDAARRLDGVLSDPGAIVEHARK